MGEDDPLDEILEDWCERRDRGDAADPEDVVRAHPELAERLRARFAAMAAIDELFSESALADSTPTRIGEYDIEREIGSGGMGTVYLASDAEGTPVALKVLHPHLLARPGFFKRFLREAEAGRKVRHENVVRTLDADALEVERRAAHFLVMEYVEGRTLRDLLANLHTVPEALLREVGLQLAAGLEAIHEQGIVHRDLKPENAIITDDHRVRIMDLGVARLVEESAVLTLEGQFAGSLPYAAPEQFRGGEVGPAADLYSLGVMLYELATGENPFRRDEAAAVMSAHLEHVPPRAEEVNPEISPFFSELLTVLMAKDPVERFEAAGALREVLEQRERSPWWTERERAIRGARPRLPAVPVRRETELYGRDTDLEILRAAWERASDGEGNTLLVEGEAGTGKSRLVDAFLKEFAGDGAQVLYGSYPPAGGLGGLSDAVLEHLGAADLEESLRPYLTVTPRLVPAFAAMLRREAPPEGREPIRADALHAVFVHLMRDVSAERPLLWVVEDLHFAEADSRQIVLSLARAVEGHPILLLLSTRPGIPEGELAHFSRLQNFRRSVLGRLSAREVILLLQDAFKSEALADKLGARIALKSDGVPFFVFEMIRGLKEGQFIEELPDGTWIESKVIEKIEVPSAVKDLIEARLRGLTREERGILDAGAVQGFEFDPGLIARVRRVRRIEALEFLADLERRSGVVRGEAGHCRFDHHQIQEVIYEDLTPDLRAEYHTLLAEAYAERIEGEPAYEEAVFLASHHLRGSRAKEGVPHLVPALDFLAESCRSDAAVELAAWALKKPRLLEGGERLEVLLRKAGGHRLRGEGGLERAVLDEAVALADGSGEAALRARVRVSLGDHLSRTSDNVAAREQLEQALELAREAEDKKLEGRATGNLGALSLSLGRYASARAHFERHLALAREIGDRTGEGVATGNLGNVFFRRGRYEEACEYHEIALILARETEDREGEARTTMNWGTVLLRLGNYEEAIAHFERALGLARMIGYRRGEAWARGNLGNAHICLGHYEEARAHQERYLNLARETGDRQGEAMATGNLGLVFLSLGRYGEALEHFARYLTSSREVEDRSGEATAMANIGNLLSGLGHYEEARSQYEQLLAIARLKEEPAEEGYALLGLAMLAERRGDQSEALGLLGECLTLWRNIDQKAYLAGAHVVLARLQAERGEVESARTGLEEALALALETKTPGTVLSATVEQARLPGGDVVAALAALGEHGERVMHAERMEARFRLWELTGDETHLEEAHRLLCHLRDHAPEEYRETMIANVPLHRDILRAWKEHQATGR